MKQKSPVCVYDNESKQVRNFKEKVAEKLKVKVIYKKR